MREGREPGWLGFDVMCRIYGIDPNASGARQSLLDELGGTFARSGDIQAPFVGIRLAREWGLDAPKWAVEYLCSKAADVASIIVNGPSGVGEAEAVGRAFGFGGRGKGDHGVIGGAASDQAAFWIAYAVKVAQLDVEQKDAEVALAAERLGVSRSTVYAALKAFGPGVEEILERQGVASPK